MENGKFLNLLPLAFVLGILFMTNTWDFASYSLLTGVALLFFQLKKHGPKIVTFLKSGLTCVALAATGIFFAIPFLLNFESIAEGIKFVHTHTPIWQLAILWGFPVILTVTFATFVISKVKSLRKLKSPDLFVLALLTTGWILIVLPEIIYVKDIYIASHYRANTMFKLTYQAFVVFYLSGGYIAIRIINSINKLSVRVLTAFFFLFVFGLLLIYPYFSVNSYYGRLRSYKGLAGNTWLETRMTDEYKLIHWFKENVREQVTFLEANGDSYTTFNVISSYTGNPTPLGWFVHEWLWRGSSEIPQERANEVSLMYTSQDVNLTKTLLDKYEVEYVMIGNNEREKFPTLNEKKFSELGRVVFASGNAKVYKLN
jgi:uncharacterized membrane protein